MPSYNNYLYRDNIRFPERDDDYIFYRNNISSSEKDDDYHRNNIHFPARQEYRDLTIKESVLPPIGDIDFTQNNGDNWINRYPNDLEGLKLITSHEKFTEEGATALYDNLCGKVEYTFLQENKNDKIKSILQDLQNSDITPEYIKNIIF